MLRKPCLRGVGLGKMTMIFFIQILGPFVFQTSMKYEVSAQKYTIQKVHRNILVQYFISNFGKGL